MMEYIRYGFILKVIFLCFFNKNFKKDLKSVKLCDIIIMFNADI